MIKAESELSPKNSKPVYDLLYGKKLRRRMILDIMYIVIFGALFIMFWEPILIVVKYAVKGVFIPQSFAVMLIFGFGLLMIVASAVSAVKCVIVLKKFDSADGKVTGLREYEFGEDGIFSRVTKDGFLCERFSVYSTVYRVTEFRDAFIVQTRGDIGAFTFSDISEGDADKLRELLRQRLGGRFVVQK